MRCSTFSVSLLQQRTFQLFPHLAIVNNAAVNTRVQVSVRTCGFLSLGIHLGVELLGHMVTRCVVL